MPQKYSDTPRDSEKPAERKSPRRILAIDSGSPVSSIALAWDEKLLGREFGVGDSSKRLLPTLDEMLTEAGGRLDQIEGLVGLRGPGSFTGLRVGLATLLGLQQSLGAAASTATTLEVLARQAQRRSGATTGRIVTTVDALRGERFVQTFDAATLEPLAEPEIRPEDEIMGLGNWIVGFGLQSLAALLEDQAASERARHDSELIEAEPLAADLLAHATETAFVWDSTTLTQPLYLRPPAAVAAAAK